MLAARSFKRGIYNNLKHTRLSRDEFVQAALYVSGVINAHRDGGDHSRSYQRARPQPAGGGSASPGVDRS